MTARRKVLPILAGALMIGISTAALGQAAKMTAGLEKFTAASRDLVKLYTGSKDEASGKAMAGKISAAAKRKDAAEKAIQAAMQKLNPKSQKDGKNSAGRIPTGAASARCRRNARAARTGSACCATTSAART